VFQIISSYIYQEIDDDRLNRIQLTSVKMTRDLSIARVYFYMDGGKPKLEAALQALEEIKGELRHTVGQEIVLRTVPRLEFHIDEGAANAQRVEELLKQI
jgi:ribosome-binding factor A